MTAKLNFTVAVNTDSGNSNLPPPETLIVFNNDVLRPGSSRSSPFQEVAV